jgi:hypothetical protein
MGLHDVYPFALSGQAIEKLQFIHQVVMGKFVMLEPVPFEGPGQSMGGRREQRI